MLPSTSTASRSWVGSEARAGPPLGLDKHPIAWYMEFLREHKFNAIRLLFNHQMIRSDEPLEPPNTAIYGADAPWEAPELEGYTYLEMFEKITDVAAEHGVLIMMAAHRLTPMAWPGNGLWKDDNGESGTIMSEGMVMQNWEAILNRLCSKWNFFAVDLQNEPHAASWGKGDESTDWGMAAERLGNRVQQHCSRLLIFVEGVGFTPGARGMDNAADGIWWGENLAGVRGQPVTLLDQTKLVYSPHTYGPSVYEQAYFSDNTFPNNMPAIWEERFDFVRAQTGVPLVIGEMGGFYKDTDKTWQDWAIGYIKANSIGIFYFALGPESDDTGGLLKEDYTEVEEAKLKLLSVLPSTEVLPLHLESSQPTAPPFPATPPPRPSPCGPPPHCPPTPAPMSPLPSPPPSPSPMLPVPPSPSPKPSVPRSASEIQMLISRSKLRPPPLPPSPRAVASVAHLRYSPSPPHQPLESMYSSTVEVQAPLSKLEAVEHELSSAVRSVSGSDIHEGGRGAVTAVAVVALVTAAGTFAIIILIGLAIAVVCRWSSRTRQVLGRSMRAEKLSCVDDEEDDFEDSMLRTAPQAVMLSGAGLGSCRQPATSSLRMQATPSRVELAVDDRQSPQGFKCHEKPQLMCNYDGLMTCALSSASIEVVEGAETPRSQPETDLLLAAPSCSTYGLDMD